MRNLKSHYVKIVDESILFFSRVFLSKILSGSSQYFVGIRGIYTGVRKECEELVFPKQSWPAAWPNNLTEPQVPAAR